MNLAARWSLPVVRRCQKNMWREHTTLAEYTLTARLPDREAAYCISGLTGVSGGTAGAPAPRRTMVEANNHPIDEAMARDEKVIGLGEDIADPPGGVMKATAGLSSRYGKSRVRATPISEQGFLGAAI